jgi:hypothetical protein
MKAFRTLAFAGCLAAMSGGPLIAATYYVSSNGSTSGDGTATSPWPTVEYALAHVGGANTILLLPGDYAPFRVNGGMGGTAAAPTIIRSSVKWGARIRSTSDYGIVTDSLAPFVVLDGFEISGASIAAIYLQANGCEIRNCWIHNNSNQGIGAYSLTGTVIDSNLIEFNGQFPHFHHGVYADGDNLTVSNNIVRYNSGLGLQLYPSIRHSLIYNNLVTDQPSEVGILIACPVGGGNNRVLNNTSCNNGAYGIRIWNGNGEVVANNICVGNADGQIMGDDPTVGTSNTFLANNLTTGDPLFTDPDKGVYWLQTGSPAIGQGSADYAPPTDFWGQPTPAGQPDQGAFAYHPSLTDPSYRANWPDGYAFCRRRDTPGMDMPDLWIAPRDLRPVGTTMPREVMGPPAPNGAWPKRSAVPGATWTGSTPRKSSGNTQNGVETAQPPHYRALPKDFNQIRPRCGTTL